MPSSKLQLHFAYVSAALQANKLQEASARQSRHRQIASQTGSCQIPRLLPTSSAYQAEDEWFHKAPAHEDARKRYAHGKFHQSKYRYTNLVRQRMYSAHQLDSQQVCFRLKAAAEHSDGLQVSEANCRRTDPVQRFPKDSVLRRMLLPSSTCPSAKAR